MAAVRRYQVLAAIITFWLGIYFAYKFAPPVVSVFGTGDVFIFWGWDRIHSGLAECIATPLPLNCLFELAKLTASVPGILVRLAICCLGSALAAISFRLLRGHEGDDSHGYE